MPSFGSAVQSVGKDVLVIKGDKVIGKGRSTIMVGDEWIGITFTEGEVVDLVKELKSVKLLGTRRVNFRYYPNSGFFEGPPFAEDDDEVEKIFDVLGQTLVVDEFNFGFGICPDHFKQVEGFASKRDATATGPGDNAVEL